MLGVSAIKKPLQQRGSAPQPSRSRLQAQAKPTQRLRGDVTKEAPARDLTSKRSPESARATAERLLSLPAEPSSSGLTVVRWNHYRKHFRVHNGVIRFEDIDKEYSFSFVYRGAFGRRLRRIGGPYLQGDQDYFIGVELGEPGVEYGKYLV